MERRSTQEGKSLNSAVIGQAMDNPVPPGRLQIRKRLGIEFHLVQCRWVVVCVCVCVCVLVLILPRRQVTPRKSVITLWSSQTAKSSHILVWWMRKEKEEEKMKTGDMSSIQCGLQCVWVFSLGFGSRSESGKSSNICEGAVFQHCFPLFCLSSYFFPLSFWSLMAVEWLTTRDRNAKL